MLKNTKKFKYIILFIVLLILAIATFFLYRDRQSDSTSTPTINNSSDQASNVNYDPPTEQDKQEAEDNKQRIIEKSEQTNSSDNPSVIPAITYAGVYDSDVEVGGYVPNIFEEGGTCTATFTREGSSSISKTVNAVRGANSVDCPQITLPTSQFPIKGTWSVVLSYKSSSVAGSSVARNVEIR